MSSVISMGPTPTILYTSLPTYSPFPIYNEGARQSCMPQTTAAPARTSHVTCWAVPFAPSVTGCGGCGNTCMPSAILGLGRGAVRIPGLHETPRQSRPLSPACLQIAVDSYFIIMSTGVARRRDRQNGVKSPLLSSASHSPARLRPLFLRCR